MRDLGATGPKAQLTKEPLRFTRPACWFSEENFESVCVISSSISKLSNEDWAAGFARADLMERPEAVVLAAFFSGTALAARVDRPRPVAFTKEAFDTAAGGPENTIPRVNP